MIWMILNHMSSVTKSPEQLIILTITSTYQYRLSANFSANMAIFKTRSSLIYRSAPLSA